MDMHLRDLSGYLSWDCPLDDSSVLAFISRMILSFSGDDHQILVSCMNPKNGQKHTFSFNVGCVANDGSVYLHHKYRPFYNWKTETDHGLSKINHGLYFTKVYSQRLFFYKNRTDNKIIGINVLCADVKNLRSNNDENTMSTKSNDSKSNQTKTGIDKSPKSIATKLNKTNKTSKTSNYKIGINKSNFDDNSNDHDMDQKDIFGCDTVSKKLAKWHKKIVKNVEMKQFKDGYHDQIASAKIQATYQENERRHSNGDHSYWDYFPSDYDDDKGPRLVRQDTKMYKASNDTFIFYHDYHQLYCYSECFAIDNIKNNNNRKNTNKNKNSDKCVVVIKSGNMKGGRSKNGLDYKIVDCWRQHDRLYVLRASKKADTAKSKHKKNNYRKKTLKVKQSQTDIAGLDEKEKEKKEQEEKQTQLDPIASKKILNTGDDACELWMIRLKNDAICDKIKPSKNLRKTNHRLNGIYGNNMSNFIDCVKLFQFSNDSINPHCSYYDHNTKSLLIACNNNQTNSLELSVFCLSKKDKNKSKNKSKQQKPTKFQTNVSTTANKTKVKVDSTNNVKTKQKNVKHAKPKRQKSSHLNNNQSKQVIYKKIKIPQSVQRLFDQNCKCHHLFYHIKSDCVILLIKNPSFSQYNDNDDDAKSNETDELHSMLTNGMKNNAKDYFGRMLVQMKIDFETCEILSMKCGFVNISENKCKIVCYDDIKSCVIIDTKEPTYVNFSLICDSQAYLQYRHNFIYDEQRSYMYENYRGFGKNVVDDSDFEYDDVDWDDAYDSHFCAKDKYYQEYIYDDTRKETNFRIIRLNDLVAKWKQIF